MERKTKFGSKVLAVRAGVAALAAGLALFGGVGAAYAQAGDFPNRPVKIVVPFPPGGPSDTIARLVAERLGDAWKQSVLVDNRPGAGGNIGLAFAAKQPADGYTLGQVATSTFAVNPNLYKNLPFDAEKDFVPVALLTRIANVLLVNPEVPAKSLTELIALMKSKPGALNGGYPGAGNSAHIALVMLERAAGAETTRVPYKGDADGMQALMGGQVQVYFTVSFVAAPQIKAGKVRAIAIASPQRSPGLPEVPTFAEAGLPGFMDTTAWFGLAAPTGVPMPIVRRINEEVNRALAGPKVRDYLLRIGAAPGSGTAEEFAEFARSERARWGRAVQESGVKVE
jgi:tripartite-type tricarboxylate transporter receptor subunit TctC